MNIISVVVEMPLKTRNKFEVDKNTNRIKLDRFLYSAMTYQAEYGYIENTLELDGDPLDILIISSEATFSECIVQSRVIGSLTLIDNGKLEHKILFVVAVDPRCSEINSLNIYQNLLYMR